MEFNTTLEEILVVGYVFFCMALNTIAFLIAAFYKRKVNAKVPFLGFLLSLLLGGSFIGTALLPNNAIYTGIFRTISLLGCSLTSTLSVLGLFVAMRRTRRAG